AKKAVLAERLQRSLRRKTPYVSIKRREADQKTVLSFAQQRLWFLDQLMPGNTAYLLPYALSMKGKLDMHSFERSLQELDQRHESLRTTFAVRIIQDSDPELVQVIHPVGSSSLPVIDLQVLLPKRREAEAQRLASQQTQHPCDLICGP